MTFNYSTQDIRMLAKKATELIDSGKNDEFFELTEQLLLNKTQFKQLYIFGTELGKRGLVSTERYLKILNELFNKSVSYGSNLAHFNSNPKFWSEENIRAMVLGSRISIITTALGVIGKRYPKKIIPMIKEYLITGDGWYICDGLSIGMGMILKAHFDSTLPVLVTWAKDENIWLRRCAAVSIHELLKVPGQHIQQALLVFDLLMNDNNKLVKKGMSWMLREMTKHYKNELLTFISRWSNEDNKHTKRIIIEGIKKLSRDEQENILSNIA